LTGRSKGEIPVARRCEEDALYQAALAVERDEALAAEMAEWERSTIGDGFEKFPARQIGPGLLA
jgi:hypothetical protein